MNLHERTKITVLDLEGNRSIFLHFQGLNQNINWGMSKQGPFYLYITCINLPLQFSPNLKRGKSLSLFLISGLTFFFFGKFTQTEPSQKLLFFKPFSAVLVNDSARGVIH